ncbi:MAG: hypothetical protein M3O70_13590 [Actinomycetota bacterium]|nr:hypothetical protein [Actinomycetota bacterium]
MRLDRVHSGTVPTPGEIANADLVIIYGPLRNAERAFELAGAIKLAVEHGATIAYLHGARFEDIDSCLSSVRSLLSR